jgi:hypothetical protein
LVNLSTGNHLQVEKEREKDAQDAQAPACMPEGDGARVGGVVCGAGGDEGQRPAQTEAEPQAADAPAPDAPAPDALAIEHLQNLANLLARHQELYNEVSNAFLKALSREAQQRDLLTKADQDRRTLQAQVQQLQAQVQQFTEDLLTQRGW